jgi:branched-chain amino acid transport system substrate-binding protein
MHSKIGLTIGVGILAVALTACSSAAPASTAKAGANSASPADGVTATTITLGTVSDQSGPTSGIQLPWLHGVQAAMTEANKEGGINGRTVNILSGDDKYDAALGLAAYKKLVSQTPAVAILGLNNSSVQAAVIPNIATDKIPVISGQSTTKLALVPIQHYMYGLTPTYADQLDVMVAYAKKKLNKTSVKVALVQNGGASGIEVEGLLKERSGGTTGITDLGTVILPAAATTADAQLQQLIALKPDIVFFHGSSLGVNLIGKAQQKFNSKLPLIGIAPSGGPAAFAGLPPAIGNLYEYVQWTTPTPIKVAGTAKMVAAAKLAGFSSDTNNPDFVAGYVIGLTFEQGVKKAGKNLTRDSLNNALESLKSVDTGGLTGAFGFSKTDHAGVQSLVPLKWNYKTSGFEQDGTYAEYSKFITGEYAKE